MTANIKQDEHAPLVIHIVNNLKEKWPRMSTTWMEEFGFDGLIDAYKTFKESSGVKFSTYAYNCIRNSVIRYCKFWYKRIVFEYGIRQRGEYYTGDARVLCEVADKDLTSESQEHVDHIINSAPLNDRQRKAILLRMEQYTFDDIGESLGVTRERGRQIYKRAAEILRKHIRTEVSLW